MISHIEFGQVEHLVGHNNHHFWILQSSDSVMITMMKMVMAGLGLLLSKQEELMGRQWQLVVREERVSIISARVEAR